MVKKKTVLKDLGNNNQAYILFRVKVFWNIKIFIDKWINDVCIISIWLMNSDNIIYTSSYIGLFTCAKLCKYKPF